MRRGKLKLRPGLILLALCLAVTFSIPMRTSAVGVKKPDDAISISRENGSLESGSLTIANSFVDLRGAPEYDRKFRFHVELTLPEGESIPDEGYPCGGTGTGEDIFDGRIIFTIFGLTTVILKDGDSLTITGLPAGTQFRVTEEDPQSENRILLTASAGDARRKSEAEENVRNLPKATESSADRENEAEERLILPKATESSAKRGGSRSKASANEVKLTALSAGYTVMGSVTGGGTEDYFKNSDTGEAVGSGEIGAGEDKTVQFVNVVRDDIGYPEEDTRLIVANTVADGRSTLSSRNFGFCVKLIPEEDSADWVNTITYVVKSAGLAPVEGIGALPLRLNEQADGSYVGEISLSGGQQAEIEGIPAGTAYEITEERTSRMGYQLAVLGGSGEITADGPFIAAFANTRYTDTGTGSLIVHKLVSGPLTEEEKTEREFAFQLSLTDAEGNEPSRAEYPYEKSGPGTAEGAADVTGNISGNGGTFTLKHGQKLRIYNLPSGMSYKVTEVVSGTGGSQTVPGGGGEANPDYVVSGSVSGGIDGEFDDEKHAGSGCIKADETAAVWFFNTKAGATGSLRVVKEVQGNEGDKDKEFQFRAEFANGDGQPYSGDFACTKYKIREGDTEIEEDSGSMAGGAVFGLKHGELIYIEHIPVGAVYTVSETDAEDYTVTVSRDGQIVETQGQSHAVSGTIPGFDTMTEIPGNGGASVVFVNKKESRKPDDPSPGNPSVNPPGPVNPPEPLNPPNPANPQRPEASPYPVSGTDGGDSGNETSGRMAAAGRWIQDEKGWRYQNPDGTWRAGGWAQLLWNGERNWYYFNEDSYMAVGWITDGGLRYYLHPISDGTKGHLVENVSS